MRRYLACALLVVAGGCRAKACDDAALQRVVTAFEDRSSDGRAAGFVALADACPALPPGLRTDLLSRFRYAPGDPDMTVQFPPLGDEAHAALFRRTCLASADERRAAFEAESDRALRTSCDFDRYGVLGPDEPFVREDIGAFMLYEWLTSTGADPDAARTLARTLMYVSAPPEERELDCVLLGAGCEHFIAQLGVELPRSTSNAPLERGVAVRISRTHVSVEGEQVLALADDGFEWHVAPKLLAVLDAARVDEDPGVLVQADVATRFETLANVVFTATKAGYERIDLAVVGEQELRRIPLVVPREWMRPREWPRMERALELELHVHRDAVEVAVSGPGTRFAGDGHAALIEHIKEYKQLFPHETVAKFVVDDDVSLQALVSVMDIARGLDCKLPWGGEEIPEDCLFWQAIIETDPRLYWNIDRIAGISLGEPSIELREAGGVKPKPLLLALASEREAIEACLVSELALLRDLGDELLVSVARAPDGKLVARVMEKSFLGTPLERCVLDPLGLALPKHTGDFFHSVGLELRIPVTLELRAGTD